MTIIYKPKGEALEYAELGLNYFKTCSHFCRYCYVPNSPWIDRGEYHGAVNVKDNILNRVEAAAKKLSKKQEVIPPIHMSFVGDPYQPAEKELKVTRNIIKILIKYNLPFQILTKGGMLATRDFDLLKNYPQCSFGVTLTSFSNELCKEWEPNAASWQDRVQSIIMANRLGIKTWVSLEPVIVPHETLEIIKQMYRFVDHWKIGPLNYHKLPASVDWNKFHFDVKKLLDSLGADYYLKKSLSKLIVEQGRYKTG